MFKCEKCVSIVVISVVIVSCGGEVGGGRVGHKTMNIYQVGMVVVVCISLYGL